MCFCKKTEQDVSTQRNQSIKNACFYFSIIIMTAGDMYILNFFGHHGKYLEKLELLIQPELKHTQMSEVLSLRVPDFGRSANPISTRGDRLCPPNYYWHPRIFKSSYGPPQISERWKFRHTYVMM